MPSVEYADPGGEHYFSLGMSAPNRWNTVNAAATLVNNAPAGASTQYAIQVLGSSAQLFDRVVSDAATKIVGGRFYVPSGGFQGTRSLFQFLDSSTMQCDVRIDVTGKLFVTRNGTTIGSTSSLAIGSGSGWHYIDVKATISTSSGVIQVYVDNVQYLNLTGLNTQASANATTNRIFFCNPMNSTAYWKDIYILDPASGAYSARLGDVTVGALFMNGAGVNQDWANNGGASQTASVQDGITHTGTWPDGDASYISSSTANQISDFAHQALSLTGTLYAVIHESYMRKDDAGSRTVKQVCISGGTTEASADISLSNNYGYYYDVLETDPNTSAQWTVANFNNATFGVKEIS